MSQRPKIFISGLGVVSPLGVGADRLWQGLCSGKSGVGVRPEFSETDWPFRLAAKVVDFDPKQLVKPRKALKVMCPPIQQGCAAANLAMDHAGIGPDSLNPDRIATVFGTEVFLADPHEMSDAFSRCLDGQKYQHERWATHGMTQIEPLWMLKYLPNMVASHISIALDARGPSNSICQGDASSMLSIIEAADLLQRGWADVAIAGGTGSNTQLTCMLYRGGEHLSHQVNDPERSSRPFDFERDGSVPGEGAAAIVLETEESLQRRGGSPLACLSGWARGFCSLQNQSFSDRLRDLCERAIQNAGVTPNQIGQFNPQGNSQPLDDRLEATAIHQLNPAAAVLAVKHNFGNLGPGSGAVEVIAGIQAMIAGVIPGAINYQTPDPAAPVNLCRETRNWHHDHLLKISFSSTGQIAVAVLSKAT